MYYSKSYIWAQTWTLTQSRAKKLQTTQRRMERSILGLKRDHKIKNQVIRGKTLTRDVIYTTTRLKFKYAGHLARTNNTRWHHKVTFWTPFGHKGKVGKPAKRWREELIGRVETTWGRAEKNKPVWHKIGEVYTLERGSDT